MSSAEKPEDDSVFKCCSACDAVWMTRDDFLSDPKITLVGYQPHFENLVAGLFLFNHSCQTTLAVPASAFRDLYQGPVFLQRAKGSSFCPLYCQHHDELRPCPAACECAYVREMLQLVRNWPKRPVASGARRASV